MRVASQPRSMRRREFLISRSAHTHLPPPRRLPERPVLLGGSRPSFVQFCDDEVFTVLLEMIPLITPSTGNHFPYRSRYTDPSYALWLIVLPDLLEHRTRAIKRSRWLPSPKPSASRYSFSPYLCARLPRTSTGQSGAPRTPGYSSGDGSSPMHAGFRHNYVCHSIRNCSSAR